MKSRDAIRKAGKLPYLFSDWRGRQRVERSNSHELHTKSLVGRKVKSRDGQFVGHAITDADKSIIVLGHHHYRFDIPKSKIQQITKDVILSQEYEKIFTYSKPSTKSIDKVSMTSSE